MANEVTVHVRARDHTDRTFNDIERKVRGSFAARMRSGFGRVGVDSSASFGAGFLNGVSMGRLGGGVATRLAPDMAKAGARMGGLVGAALAGAVLVQASNILAAGLPLLLGGALVAGPIAWLVKGNVQGLKDLEKQEKQVASLKKRIAAADPSNFSTKTGKANARARQAELREELRALEKIVDRTKEQTQAWSKTKTHASGFMDRISKPLQLPFEKSLTEVRKGLDRLEKPMIRILKQIGPTLAPFTKGVMDGFVNFVKELEPKMPTIKAAMKAWAEAAPKIGKAMGEFLAKIMKDPEGTVQALEDLARAMKDVAIGAAEIISTLGKAASAYGRFAGEVDKWEKVIGGGNRYGPLGSLVEGIKKGKTEFQNQFDRFRGWIEPKMENLTGMMSREAKEAVTGVRNWFGKLPGWLREKADEATSALSRRWNEAKNAVSDRARGAYNAVRNWFGKIPGWVSRNAKEATDRLRQRWNEARTVVTERARSLVNRTVDTLRTLPGRVRSAIASLSDRVRSEAEAARANAVNKARDLVNGFVTRMRTLPSRARSAIASAKARIQSVFSGAGDWLRSRGSAVINGLLAGLKAPWQKVKDWVSGIAKWIKDHKGPISLDQQLLVPAGKALMGGLLSGLKFGFGPVGSFVYKAGSKVADIIGRIKDQMAGSGDVGGSPNGRGGLGPRAAAARAFTMARWGIKNIGGYANRNIAGTNQKSMHAFGKAIDIMTYNGGAIAKFFAGPGRKLFGVNNVIWQRRIHNAQGWHPYRGIPHMNHVHVDFFGKGGVIREPVVGVGTRSGRGYVMGENGPETITPGAHGPGRGGGGASITVMAQTNANPHSIASEVAWVLKTSGY